MHGRIGGAHIVVHTCTDSNKTLLSLYLIFSDFCSRICFDGVTYV